MGQKDLGPIRKKADNAYVGFARITEGLVDL
jgi:hypothetical protein